MDHRVMAGVAISALCGVVAHAPGSVVIDRVERFVSGSLHVGVVGDGVIVHEGFGSQDPGLFEGNVILSEEFQGSVAYAQISQSSYVSESRIQASLHAEGAADLVPDQRSIAKINTKFYLSVFFTIHETTPVLINYVYERHQDAPQWPATIDFARLSNPIGRPLESLPTGGLSGIVENQTLMLEPGSYRLSLASLAFSQDTSYSFSSFESWADLHFDMVFIPSPGSFAPLALAGLAAIRRRR